MSIAPPGAIVLLDKEKGMSSFAALAPFKRAFGTRKIGHTGTLDPFAEGLLIACVGYATKLASLFDELDKKYIATIHLGVETDTLDPEGTEVATGPVPDEFEVRNVLSRFLGEIEQAPPAYSAVKVAGKRSYALARSGELIVHPARKVFIRSLTLTHYAPPRAEISVECSKGPYIRVLGRDIARECGSVAHLTALKRTDVGPFSIEEIDRDKKYMSLTPIDAIRRLPGIYVAGTDQKTLTKIYHGGAFRVEELDPIPNGHGICGIVDDIGRLVAVVELSENEIRYKFVIAREPGVE